MENMLMNRYLIIIVAGFLINLSSIAMQQTGYTLNSWMDDDAELVRTRNNPNMKPSKLFKDRRPNDAVANFFSLNLIKLDGLEKVANKDKITDLNVTGNRLSNLPSTIKQLTSLQELDLSNNQFKQVNFGLLTDLKNLSRLLLFANQLTTLVPLPILPGLKNLGLSNNEITSIASDAFKNVPQIEIIQLDGNKLTQFDPALIKDLKNLKVLNLQGNPLNAESIKVLKENKPNPKVQIYL